MAETRWTAAQSAAIEQNNKTILVSAAAGSGKTATLTQRLIRKLTDTDIPADISRMLIVTFTRAAAGELKTRIGEALAKAYTADPQNKHLFRQKMALGSAKICTIDSFYLDVIKENFQKVSLPPKFRMADEAELSLLHRQTMNELIEDCYARPADDFGNFIAFVEHFTGARDDDKLSDLLLSLYRSLMTTPEGTRYVSAYADRLEAEADGEFLQSTPGLLFKQNLIAELRSYEELFSGALAYFDTHGILGPAYSPSFGYDRAFCANAVRLLEESTYESVREHLLSYNPISLGRVKAADKTELSMLYQSRRTDIVKRIREIAQKSFALTGEQIVAACRQTADVCRLMYRLLSEYDVRIGEEKRARGLCEFSDLKRLAGELLVNPDGTPTPLALSYRERFDEIYIDEYQDVDFVQDRIFSAIARPDNRFMVGDIKQSIYSFRGAQPAVFAHYKKTFPTLDTDTGDTVSIFMSENFRCDRNIIEFSNLVFSFLFGTCPTSIDYTEGDNLIFSKKQPDDYASPKVSVVSICTDTDESEEDEGPRLFSTKDTEAADAEALYVAREIERLLASERKADGTPILPGDIAVIARAKSTLALVSAALSDRGIPTVDATAQSLFESPEVMLMLCLLSTIDNPQKDIYLAGLLRSPFFGFSLEDLIEIRQSADLSYSLFDALTRYTEEETADAPLLDKCRFFLSKLASYRHLARGMAVDRLIRYVMEDLHIALIAPPGSQNLLKFYDYARHFEATSFRGLYHFIQYINNIIEDKAVIPAPPTEADANSVRLMTIHQSKGLEFPVCFICGAAKPFNRDDLKKSMLFEYSAGIGLMLADPSGLARYNNPIREAIAHVIGRLQTEEEMRILYVAMTRARERLYITGKSHKAPEKWHENARLTAMFPSPHALLNARTYMDWILAAIVAKSGSSFELTFLSASELADSSTISPMEAPRVQAAETDEEDVASLLHARFSYRYPYEHLTHLPAKLSVSKLYPGVIDEEEETMIDQSELPAFAERPDFSGSAKARATSAEKGIATHLFLQFCRLEAGLDLHEEIARLTEHKFISRETAERINVAHLEAFFKSHFFQSVITARRIEREFRFHVMLPAAQFTKNAERSSALEDTTIAVQGVIDLIVEDENGNLILCDYKTDYVTHEERQDPELLRQHLSERHGRQLLYYSRAVTQIFGRPPSRVLIYSLPFGEALPIDLPES